MKKLLFLLVAVSAFAIGAVLSTVDVKAQCNGVFPNNFVCGNTSGSAAPPSAIPIGNISGSVNWINVKSSPYNAVGNGVADDTAAINAAIAAFNTSGGTLYFPSGTYLTTTTLTTITTAGIIRGDGFTNLAGNPITPPAPTATLIETSSLTVSGLTFNSKGANAIYDLSLYNISGTTPIAGAGITQTSTISFPKFGVDRVQIRGYYVGVDLQEAAGSVNVENTTVWDPVLYGVRIRNLVNADDGGWELRSVIVQPITRNATSGIRWDGSGGGGLMNNVHVIGTGGTGVTFTNGIDIQASGLTVNMGIMNFSIENINGPSININGSLPNIWIVGGEIAGLPACSVNCYAIMAQNGTSLVISNINVNGMNSNPLFINNYPATYVNNIQWSGVNPYSSAFPADHDGTAPFGYKISGSEVDATMSGVGNGQFPNIVAKLPGSGSTGLPAAMSVVNDLNHAARMQYQGSTVASPITDSGNLQADTKLIILSGLANGTDPVSIRPGGTATSRETILAQANGHIAIGSSNTLPTIAGGCGGTSSIVAGTDVAAFVTGQNTAVTSCIIQFGTAYASAPTCTASGNSSPLTGTITTSTTSLTVHFTSTTSYTWSYTCYGT